MPNHCSNAFTFKGSKDDIAKLKSLLIIRRQPDDPDFDGAELSFDFNGIIPMPASLDISCGSDSSFATQLLQMPPDELLSRQTTLFPKQIECLYVALGKLFDWQKLTVGHAIHLLETYPELQSQCRLNLEAGRICVQNIKLYGSPNWYDWAIKNWGTKWNAYELILHDDSDTVLSGYFETAWSPPQPVFEAIAKQFPNVEIEAFYIEEGMGFAGTFVSDDEGGLADIECPPADYADFAFIHFSIDLSEDDDE